MSQEGAILQSYNNEIVKSLVELNDRREEINKDILAEEERKKDLQEKIQKLVTELSDVNDSLVDKYTTRGEYDKIITETETIYKKIVDSSEILLNSVRKESSSLKQRENTVPAGAKPKLAASRSPKRHQHQRQD